MSRFQSLDTVSLIFEECFPFMFIHSLLHMSCVKKSFSVLYYSVGLALGSNAILNKVVKEVEDVSSVLERRISSRNIAEDREFLGRLKTAISCGVAHHCGVQKTLHMGHFFRG